MVLEKEGKGTVRCDEMVNPRQVKTAVLAGPKKKPMWKGRQAKKLRPSHRHHEPPEGIGQGLSLRSVCQSNSAQVDLAAVVKTATLSLA